MERGSKSAKISWSSMMDLTSGLQNLDESRSNLGDNEHATDAASPLKMIAVGLEEDPRRKFQNRSLIIVELTSRL